MASKVTMEAPNLVKFLKNTKTFDKVLEKVWINAQKTCSKKFFLQVNILSVGEGKCTAELKVEESHTNPMGGLHGGMSATLLDCISTYALMSKLGKPGVSVDIHIR
jgi:acyl-coenzyme A thioesterase 13